MPWIAMDTACTVLLNGKKRATWESSVLPLHGAAYTHSVQEVVEAVKLKKLCGKCTNRSLVRCYRYEAE